ncbi:tetratricopeptide repeat protein [Novispirillum sp. DQ9]|uniref:tetratricopeptide repeat protein n=1 Tax=Novispirillum sp. DQ9 TaxID=3398612 RepID=UPI003C7E77AD
MLTDRQGTALTGATPAAVDAYDAAVHAFNIYRGDPIALIDQAIAEAPQFAGAHIFKALACAVATEPEATAAARALAGHARTLPMSDRDRSLLAAVDHITAGNWTAAGLALDAHSMCHPRDLVALQAGHLVDFYRANARNLRDRIARALPQWSADVPGYSIVLGMYAFGLEESGDYARAEDTGRRAVEAQPLDCWAHHAVAHVLEMQGRAAEGVAWMRDRVATWSGADNFFKVHNWWHQAMFHLDRGETDQALALYDGPVRAERSAVVLDMIDASALLWRLELAGVDVGDRWGELAAAWDAHADGRLYPFNDWHAAMAYLGAGREADAARLLAACRSADAANGEVAAWARRTGADLIEGFTAFRRGDHATAVERLHAARFIANSFGGSNAQRDIIDWTLTEAALRGGLRDVARALVNERLALKPRSGLNLRFAARLDPPPAAGMAAE